MARMSAPTKPAGFGTLGGVFTPCTLTILGVIMFLRFGQVVGQSGVVWAVGIVLGSKLLTGATSLSLAAIATNTRVRGGGAYFLISRSLGVEFGGAIGVVFYLAQAISVAMYVIGFTEAFVDAVPALGGSFALVASAVNIVTFLCVYIGAGWTIKVQYLILTVLGAALASFYVGAAHDFDPAVFAANRGPGFLDGQGPFTMFALFFPAVTGIMAGANMSGDLANPARSIPRGTLASVGVTALVYLSLALLLGGVRSREELITDHLVMKEVAVWPLLITAGVFAATLSSALSSMMGAPRILQALARDGIFGRLGGLGIGAGVVGEPRRATVLTFVIAQACILLGDLDAIAPVITMFFLTTYGLLNLATFDEAATRNPSYRPTFRWCHWTMSLAGALGCLVVMLLINWVWAVISIVVIAVLHASIRYREFEGRWGDLQSGVMYERARRNLLQLETQSYHPKNWRPTVLALSGAGWTRPHLAVYGHWLTAGHGILSLAQVVRGSLADHAERRDNYEQSLRKFIAKEELQAFPAVVIAEELWTGVDALVQCHGIGGVRPNTVLLGWPTSEAGAEEFGRMLRRVARMRRSIVVVRQPDLDPIGLDGEPLSPWEVPVGTVDVWWRGMQNGALMLLIAHLLRQNPEWHDNHIRLLRAVSSEDARESVIEHLRSLAVESRIHAEPVVIEAEPAAVPARITATSEHAAVVLLGFEVPEAGDELAFYRRMEALAEGLPRVLFIDSAGGMELNS